MIMRQKFQLRVLPSPLTKLDVNIKRMRSVSSLWMVWEWSSLSDVLTLLSCSLQLHCSLMPDIHDVEVGKKSSSGIRAKRSLSNPSITTSYASERRASVWRNLNCNRLSFNPTLILFGMKVWYTSLRIEMITMSGDDEQHLYVTLNRASPSTNRWTFPTYESLLLEDVRSTIEANYHFWQIDDTTSISRCLGWDGIVCNMRSHPAACTQNFAAWFVRWLD